MLYHLLARNQISRGILSHTHAQPKVDLSIVKSVLRSIARAAKTFDVIDSEKVLIKITNPVDPTEYFAAIYVWQKKFATELRQKFMQMWDNVNTP